MGTVTKSIGTSGRDYSTLAAWAAALPANLVSDGNSYVGQCYNDSEFTGTTTLLTLAGHTTDATHDITLTAAPGQSFRDNANVRTNALNYNASNGVAAQSSTTYAGFSSFAVINISDDYVTLSGLQLKSTGANAACIATDAGAGNTHLKVLNCILITTGINAPIYHYSSSSCNWTVNNSLIATLGANSSYIVNSTSLGGTIALNFCDIVSASDAADTPVSALSGVSGQTFNVENCAIFRITNVSNTSGTGVYNYTTCMTDVASPPSGVTGSKTYTNQFQNVTVASGDWREKAGADLQGAGTADATNGATDIAGTTRPQGGNWDIGCWELDVDTLMGAMVM